MFKGIAAPLVATVSVAVLITGYAVADAYDRVPGILTLSAPVTKAFDDPASVAPVVAEKLPEAKPWTAEQAAQVAALVEKFRTDLVKDEPQARTSVLIVDAASGETLAELNSQQALQPASTTKLIASVTALTRLGAGHRFTTSTTLSGGTVTLVAGGDQLLGAGQSDPAAVRGHAGLMTLADETAAELQKQGVTEVSLALDDTIFGDQARGENWVSEGNTAEEGPVAALAINAGHVDGNVVNGFYEDPALEAAKVFQQALISLGVKVSGDVTRAENPQGAKRLASVSSATLAEIVRELLKVSDNTLADGVCRAAAVAAGSSGDFTGQVANARAVLEEFQVPTAGLELHDCSGLSTTNRISAATEVALLQAAADPKNPQIHEVFAGMPVSAFDGTQATRMVDMPGAGRVRAKTGTLQFARALAGVAVTESGHVFYMAVLVDSFTGSGLPITAKMDEMLNSVVAL